MQANANNGFSTLAVRDERPDELAAIRNVIARAFATAPHASGTEGAIVDALRGDGALSMSLVADVNGIVGHIAFSPITIDGIGGEWYGLGPVSVSPDFQGRGIGGALIRAGLERLRAVGAAGCVVLGEPHYYSRFGFEHDPRLIYPGPPPQYFQRLLFRCSPPTGTVAYHPAFDAAM